MEEAPDFLRWLNSIASPPVPENGFLAANLPSLLITALLAVATAFFRHKAPALALLAWLSYFMFANTLFHVTATVALHRYSPGLITAVALYLPYFFWFSEYLRTALRIRTRVVAAAALLASLAVYLQWNQILYKAASL